jgi:hypothetical protein
MPDGTPGYRPGRDDTRWGKVQRELRAEWALVTFEHELGESMRLNERYGGRWHVWFVAQGTDTVEWLARPAGQGEPLLTAPTAEQLVALIDQQ